MESFLIFTNHREHLGAEISVHYDGKGILNYIGGARLEARAPGRDQVRNLPMGDAFTVRLAKTGYLHPSGSRTDSPGIRRDVIQRADHTEERSYGSAQTGGFDAADFARRVDAAGGDVTAAVHQWLVETGRIRPDAQIIHLEIRTWRPR